MFRQDVKIRRLGEQNQQVCSGWGRIVSIGRHRRETLFDRLSLYLGDKNTDRGKP